MSFQEVVVNVRTMLICLLVFLFAAGSAAAEQTAENPSFYSFAEIVQKLPEMWAAAPSAVQEMMKEYPDFVCSRRYDLIACESVNNKYSAEIHVTYQFTSEREDAEFDYVVFSMPVSSTEQVQRIVEMFWLDGMAPAKISGYEFAGNCSEFYFRNDSTMESYSVYFGDDGAVWLVLVNIGFIRG